MLTGKRFLCVLALTVLLSACGEKEHIGPDSVEKSTHVDIDYELLEEKDITWKDNSLDSLQAVFNLPIENVIAEGEQAGGVMSYFVGETGAVRFKNHLLGYYKKNWSGANGIDTQGNAFSKQISPDPDEVGAQVDLIGPIAGNTSFVAYRDEYDDDYNIIGQVFFVLDKAFQVKNSFHVEGCFNASIDFIAGDKNGYIYALIRHGTDYSCVVFSEKGEKIYESIGAYIGFRTSDNGIVFVCEEIIDESQPKGQRLFIFDTDKKDLREIAKLEWQNVMNQVDSDDYLYHPFVTAKGDSEIIYCGIQGVYRYHANSEKMELLYRWRNHGISVHEIKDAYAKDDGTVEIIYKDKEGYAFIVLKPTFEESEVKTITFAVSPYNKDKFLDIVADFNKKYPTYNIEIKDDYEETPLLTQLGAGKGPILIDTTLTGFDGLEKLWLPMDGFLEKTGLEDQLIPQVKDFGRIGERTYGIVTNFFIKTLVARDYNLTDWDYDEFLNAVEKFDGSVFAYEFSSSADNRMNLINTLNNGSEDNYFWDKEKERLLFGTPSFNRVLMLAEKAKEQPLSNNGKALQSGKALCEIVNIFNVESLARLRVRLEREGILAVGYPMKNGARHLLVASQPITIRSTASAEEKQMAYTFLKMLLSYDCVSKNLNGYNVDTSFSVRKDILREQFDYYEFTAYPMNKEYNDDMPELDREKDGALYEELLENAAIIKNFPADLQRIFDEEFGAYLNDEIPANLLDRHLESRVRLYLDEN